jgi:hypothetical protein
VLQQKPAWPKSVCLVVSASTAGNNHSWTKRFTGSDDAKLYNLTPEEIVLVEGAA